MPNTKTIVVSPEIVAAAQKFIADNGRELIISARTAASKAGFDEDDFNADDWILLAAKTTFCMVAEMALSADGDSGED